MINIVSKTRLFTGRWYLRKENSNRKICFVRNMNTTRLYILSIVDGKTKFFRGNFIEKYSLNLFFKMLHF